MACNPPAPDGINFSMPDPAKKLARDDERRKAGERLEALLLEGEESELTKQDFEDIRKQALQQLKRRKKKGLTRLVARDLGGPRPAANPATIFDLGASGSSDIAVNAGNKDAMLAEAFASARRARFPRRH